MIVVLMAALKAAKSEVRKSLKRAIAGLSEVDRRQQSVSLCQKVIGSILTHYILIPAIFQLMETSAYQSSKRVSVFISMNDEVDTTSIIHVSHN